MSFVFTVILVNYYYIPISKIKIFFQIFRELVENKHSFSQDLSTKPMSVLCHSQKCTLSEKLGK